MALTDLIPGGQSFSDQVSASTLNPLNMIQNISGKVSSGINQFILKPANAKGLTGFIFDFEGETVVNHQSEITDHYSEQNTFVNDHAAQKPARITLRGFSGELVNNPNTGVIGVLNTLQGKLTQLPAILGKYTPGVVDKLAGLTTTATTVVNKVDNAIGRVQNIVGLVLGSTPSTTRQQKAYQQLYCLWQANAVFTLDTPFNYFTCVMIETMTFVQDEITKDWSEISVTVKEVRFVGVDTSGGLSPQLAYQKLAGRAALQGQFQTNQGKAQGSPTSFSSLFSSFGHVQGPTEA